MTETKQLAAGRHPIRVVALRTGLTPSVLRAWERRYGVVTPSRSDGGQRRYSDADIERLSLLNRATQAGRGISQVATLGTTELRALVAEDETALRAQASVGRAHSGIGGLRTPQVVDRQALEAAMTAVESLNAAQLETVIRRAVVASGAVSVTEQLLSPLLQRIGDRWQVGTLQPRHEHVATAVLRNVLARMTEAVQPAAGVPGIVIATPTGERHEIGAMLAAIAAAGGGWRVVYAGADLPAEDVVAAAIETEAVAVGLSVINRDEASRWGRYVAQVRQQLPPDVALILGGGATGALGVVLQRPGIVRVRDLAEFRTVLGSLATPGSAT